MRLKLLFLFLITASLLFAQNDKRKIGLIPFSNIDGQSSNDWISYGLEYLVSNKLAVISGFYLPPKEVIKEALKQSGFHSRSLDERMIYHIGKSAGVEVIISGGYKLSGQNLIVNITYHNAFNGTTILSETITENFSNLFQISTKIVQRLIELAGITLSPTEQRLLNFTLTNSVTAFESFVKAYMEDESKQSRSEVVIGLFRKAIREDPKFWEAYYNLGIVYFNDQKYSQALEQFNSVISALPNFEKPYFGRGLIYEKQKKFDLAITDFKKVTEFNPNDDKPYYYLGKISLESQDYTNAETYLNKAVELNPEYAPSYYELGNISFIQNDFRKAIDPYKKAVELDESNNRYRLRLGETYYRSQIYYSAYNEFTAVLNRTPDEPIANFMLGVTVYKQAVLEELIEAFLDMLTESGSATAGSSDVRSPRSTFKKQRAIDPLKKRAVYDQMVESFMKAIQSRPDFMEATFNLALTYYELGSYDLAEKYFKATLQINPQLIRAYTKLAEVYEMTKRLQESIDQYRKVFYLEPALIVRQPTLGEAHNYINVLDIFLKEINDKLQTNPNDPQSNLVLAKVFQAQGQYGKSANLLRKVLTVNPGNQEAKQMLARLEQYGQ